MKKKIFVDTVEEIFQKHTTEVNFWPVLNGILSLHEANIYSILMSIYIYSHRKKANISNKRLSEITGLTTRSITTIIKTLEEKGFIKTKRFSSWRYIYPTPLPVWIRRNARGIEKISIEKISNHNTISLLSKDNKDNGLSGESPGRKSFSIRRRKKKPLAENKPDMVDDIILHWKSLGTPFAKPRDNAMSTSQAKKILRRLFRRDRDKVIEVMTLAHQHFTNPYFKYKSPKNLSLLEFLKISVAARKHSNFLNSLGEKSWYAVFRNWPENKIYDKLYTVPKDRYPRLTETLSKIISTRLEIPPDQFSPPVRAKIVKAVNRAVKFAERNKIGENNLFVMIDRLVKTKKEVNFIASDYFWNNQIPMELVEAGVFKSLREIKL